MNWVRWLIPLVAVFVVILINLVRIAQEERKKSSRRRPGPGETPARPRRPQSDVERFLEEINRRRREGGEQPRPPVTQRAPAPRPVAQRPARRETPSAAQELASVVPVKSRPARDTAGPAKRLPSQPSREPQRIQPTSIVEEVVVATVIPAPVPSGDVTAGAPAAVIALKPETPTNVMLRQLLRNPQGVKAAFVLREVLDRPLCRRPPRAGPRA